jgi:hypothetical protein
MQLKILRKTCFFTQTTQTDNYKDKNIVISIVIAYYVCIFLLA